MSTPRYVPRAKPGGVRAYESPPLRVASWTGTRPGELREPAQPVGPQLGHQGPDQGYVLRLVGQFEGRLTLAPGEWEDDALAGAAAVALKRASLAGRAPVVHDLRLALNLFGFLGDAPGDLVQVRGRLFEGVAHPNHYVEQRRIADLVPDETLRMTPDEVADRVPGAWRTLLRAELGTSAPARPGVPTRKVVKKVKKAKKAKATNAEPSGEGQPPLPSDEGPTPAAGSSPGPESGSMFGRSSDAGERKKKSPSQAWLRRRRDV